MESQPPCYNMLRFAQSGDDCYNRFSTSCSAKSDFDAFNVFDVKLMEIVWVWTIAGRRDDARMTVRAARGFLL